MTDAAVAALRGAVMGTVVEPDASEFGEHLHVFNARFNRRPALVVSCQRADDVAQAVRFARRQGVPVSVKGGGHSYAANTIGNGSVLIDLAPMRSVIVDPVARTATVEAGATWSDLDRATQQYGLATPGPTVSSVGVAGSTLGGGGGYLSRKHGLALDNLVSVDLVTAEGRLVHASAEQHPDLFWAVRGGGGNVGAATSFQFRLHEAGPEVFAGQVFHRFEAAGDLLRRYRDFMRTAPDDVMCYPAVLRIPPLDLFPVASHGTLAVDLIVFHASSSGESALRPLMEFGDPIVRFAGPQAYTAVQQQLDPGLPAGQRYESRWHDFDELTDEAIDVFTAQVGDLPGAFTLAYFLPAGGALARVAPTATAYPHRQIAHSLHVLAGWSDAGQDAAMTSWVRRVHGAMAPFATGGVYVNLLGTDETDRVPKAYGENYARLADIKRAWDPDNVFRFNHNVT